MTSVKNRNTFKKQEGLALLMSLIMLLLVTVIGVSAVRMSISDTQISGNSMYSNLVFQGAETGLSRAVSNNNLYHIIDPATDRTSINQLNAFPDDDVIGGGKLKTKASISYDRTMSGPPITAEANSTEFTYQIFTVTAESKLDATSARDKHTEGRAIQAPDQ